MSPCRCCHLVIIHCRSCIVVSIDPATARDLDDALHVEAILSFALSKLFFRICFDSSQVLDDGSIEVGVHIADVSFFVRPGTALDAEAKLRSTTV